MMITKGAELKVDGIIPEDDMKLINEFSTKELTEEEVFVFSMILCDNDIDRDFERFTVDSLYDLGKLFVGKTGIFDHNWSAAGQKARIFKTEVLRDESRRAAGEDYMYLKGTAYMLRTDSNKDLIAEIEGGIKREVSIGCSVAESRCSICGEIFGSPACCHVKGREYGNKVCYVNLECPTDAYEWSFVAVPAQRNAGVVKKFGTSAENITLDEYVDQSGNDELVKELRQLRHSKEVSEEYMKSLRSEVINLGLLAESSFKKEFLAGVAEKLDEEQLKAFKKAFEHRVDELYPPVCQLVYEKGKEERFPGEEFLI